jgi:hypothetical protein
VASIALTLRPEPLSVQWGVYPISQLAALPTRSPGPQFRQEHYAPS